MKTSSSFFKIMNSPLNMNSTMCSSSNYTSDSTKRLLVDSMYNIKKNQTIKEHKSTRRKIIMSIKKEKINNTYFNLLKENLFSNLKIRKISPSQSHRILPVFEKNNVYNNRFPSKLSYDICKQFNYDQKNVKHFTISCKEIAIYKNSIIDLKKIAINKENTQKTINQNNEETIKFLQYQNDKFKNNLLPAYDRYIWFLKKQIRENEEINYSLKCKKEMLKKEVEIKSNCIKKVKAKFENYLKYRNLLICFRENILELPHIFYEVQLDNYAGEIPKKIEINNKNLEKYLDIHYSIFESDEEFIRKIQYLENFVITLNEKSNNKIIENSELRTELLQAQNKKQKKNKKMWFHQQDEAQLSFLKEKNIKLINKYNSLVKNLAVIPRRSLRKYIVKIPFDLPVDVSMMIIKLQKMYDIKQYKYEYSYMYYYVAQNVKLFFKEFRNLFILENHQLTLPNFLALIKDLEDPDNIKASRIRASCVKLLAIYEDAMNKLFLLHYNRLNSPNLQKKLMQIIDNHKKRKMVANMRNQRLLFDEKRRQKRKELDTKYNKVMYKSYSHLFFDFHQKKKEQNHNIFSNQDSPIDYRELLSYQSYLD